DTHRTGAWLSADRGEMMHVTSGRREFLSGLTCGAAMLLQGERLLGAAEDEAVIPFIGTAAFNPDRPTMIWDQLTSWTTPSEQLFAVNHYGIAEPDPATWRLNIGGLISKPRSLSLDELKARPKAEHVVTL